MTSPGPHRDERGAFAVMFAIMAVMLMGVAALAVDLGNAMARESDVQGQADFAALAGAQDLGHSMSGPVPAAAVQTVADYLNDNRPLNDDSAGSNASAPRVTVGQLTDTDLTNGEVRFANGGFQVITPQARVDFGLAAAIGFTNTNAQASATIGLFSLGKATMPFYAVSPCDWANQTMSNPSTGQGSIAAVPSLANNDQANGTRLTGSAPTAISLNAVGATIQLTGRNFDNTTKVGFFPSTGQPEVVALSFTDDTGLIHPRPDPLLTPVFDGVPYTTTGNTTHTITVPVPTAVSTSQQVWWIRVYNAGTINQWSARFVGPANNLEQNTWPLQVGDAPLECGQGSLDGNFGSLFLDRSSGGGVSTDETLALNIAAGLKEPLSLDVHHSPASNGECVHGQPALPQDPAVVSQLNGSGGDGLLHEDTNCVRTDAGLPASAATKGFVSGLSEGSTHYDGMLAQAGTKDGCGPQGSSSTFDITLGGGATQETYELNNDTLTCFLTNDTTSLWDISRDSYSGPAVLDQSIYYSPRFFFVPVIQQVPPGTAPNMSIVAMRPAFLTDEIATVPGASTRLISTATPKTTVGNVTTGNGLTFTGDDLSAIRVVFFDWEALPEVPDDLPLTTYFGEGNGKPVIRLID